jgi:hypothetical protein
MHASRVWTMKDPGSIYKSIRSVSRPRSSDKLLALYKSTEGQGVNRAIDTTK